MQNDFIRIFMFIFSVLYCILYVFQQHISGRLALCCLFEMKTLLKTLTRPGRVLVLAGPDFSPVVFQANWSINFPNRFGHVRASTQAILFILTHSEFAEMQLGLHATILLRLLWSPYVIGQTIIFSSCFFFLLSFFFFSSPNFSGRKLDVYHTLAHGVALVRIQNAGLKCAARSSLQIQDAKNRHLGTTAQLRHVSTIGKKLVKQQYLLYMS